MMVTHWNLEFHPGDENPTEEGDYILYNQCDGYHIAEAHFLEGAFCGFWAFAASQEYSKDFYRAWAKLPDCFKDLYPIYARKE